MKFFCSLFLSLGLCASTTATFRRVVDTNDKSLSLLEERSRPKKIMDAVKARKSGTAVVRKPKKSLEEFVAKFTHTPISQVDPNLSKMEITLWYMLRLLVKSTLTMHLKMVLMKNAPHIFAPHLVGVSAGISETLIRCRSGRKSFDMIVLKSDLLIFEFFVFLTYLMGVDFVPFEYLQIIMLIQTYIFSSIDAKYRNK